MSRISICVVSTGDETPDLSQQTLQDYQVLRVRDEAEALARSGADAFLWLSSADRLAPRALEECVWALRSADWVTWKDTGAAPLPSLQGVAGPLGISRRVMEAPDPKPGGAVRRLPWSCVAGPAIVHSEESIPDGDGSRPYGIELDREGYWVGRFAAHLQNSGLLSGTRWKAAPLETGLMLIPFGFKHWVNRKAARPVFDLSGYQRFQPHAIYSNGSFLKGVVYRVSGSRGRQRVLLVVAHLGPGAMANRVLQLAGEINRQELEVIVVAECANDNRWKEAWMRRADHIFELGRLVEPDDVEVALLSLATNWNIEAMIVADAPMAYRALAGIRASLPGIRVADFVPSLAEGVVAGDLPAEVNDCIDMRVAASSCVAGQLQEMARESQQVIVIRDGVIVRSPPADELITRKPTVGFVGAFSDDSGSEWLPSIAREVDRLIGASKTRWLIAGAGPLEVGLRNGMRRYDAEFFRDEVELNTLFAQLDVLLVTAEDVEGDRAALAALGCARPVVAVEAEGREELITAEAGSMVTAGRDGDLRLAAALAELLPDRRRMRDMGLRGQKWVAEQYSADRARRQYQELLVQLLAPIGDAKPMLLND